MKTNGLVAIMKYFFLLIFILLSLKTIAYIYNFFHGFFNDKVIDLMLNINEARPLRNPYLHYIVNSSLTIIVYALKAYIALLGTRIFYKIDFNKPFNMVTARLLTKIGYVSLITGIIALISNIYKMWIYKVDFILVLIEPLEEGSGEFLFLSGIIFVIAYIFKKGVEIQSENELTV